MGSESLRAASTPVERQPLGFQKSTQLSNISDLSEENKVVLPEVLSRMPNRGTRCRVIYGCLSFNLVNGFGFISFSRHSCLLINSVRSLVLYVSGAQTHEAFALNCEARHTEL